MRNPANHLIVPVSVAAVLAGALAASSVARLEKASTLAPAVVPAGPITAPPVAPQVVSDVVCRDCNLLLISIDTLRADRMSLYGYHRPTTPQLEQLAQGGVVFERFYHSGGGTLESHMSMLTSLNPVTHGVTADNPLDTSRRTLAAVLHDAGFATAGFVDDGWMLGKYGFASGFDVYDDSGGRFAAILPKAHRWLQANGDQRFFLFLHTYDVHSEFRRLPYECPGEAHWRYAQRLASFDGCRGERCATDLLSWINGGVEEGKWTLDEQLNDEELSFVSDLYDGCIGYVDARIADILGALRALGHFDDTLVVITSDHGEEFGDHGMMLHNQLGWEEMSHIPLLLKLPYSRLGGKRVAHLAAMIDLMPTVLDILSVPTPPQAQGLSLVRTFAAAEPVREDMHIYDAMVSGHWKYFAATDGLYDLNSDPQERTNVAELHPEVMHQLGRRLRTLAIADRSAATKGSPGSRVVLTAEERARLQALGYLQ